jgi:hypothetical protein
LLIIEPLIGAVVLTLWIGAYAVVFGVLLLVLGFQLNSIQRHLMRWHRYRLQRGPIPPPRECCSMIDTIAGCYWTASP